MTCLVCDESCRFQEFATSLVIPKDMHYLLIFDGGSRGNPGEGYGSYALIRCDTGQCRVHRLEFPGELTNNEAEYRSLIEGLLALLSTIRAHGKDPKRYRVEIRGDSRLVIYQLTGRWKVHHPRMRELWKQARKLLEQFGRVRLIHHERQHSVAILGH